MIEKLRLENILFLDIETVPQEEHFNALDNEMQQLWEHKTQYQRKAELEAKKRASLIFIAQSKYSGFCREKDCGSRWQQGDPMYWDKITHEVFCAACGGMMSDGA